MELKHSTGQELEVAATLLIVPYGIETLKQLNMKPTQQLLIVPYGIETWVGLRRIGLCKKLLIVPYGIET